MGKFFYIILISFVCFTITSCAEIDQSSESVNSILAEHKRSSAYDILIENVPISSENLFITERTSNDKGRYFTPKKNNIFLVKQNRFGKREWTMDLEISEKESGISMTFDSDENVYITGYKRNVLKNNNNTKDFTVLLFKYNSYGNREWVRKLGKSEVENGARMIVDSSDNIYVTGFSSEVEPLNAFGPQNTLLAKYDINGNRKWEKTLRSTSIDFAWDLTVDSKDNIYVAGFSDNSFAQNNVWQEDILLMKFNKEGIKF